MEAKKPRHAMIEERIFGVSQAVSMVQNAEMVIGFICIVFNVRTEELLISSPIEAEAPLSRALVVQVKDRAYINIINHAGTNCGPH
jgi:hypothetical protein